MKYEKLIENIEHLSSAKGISKNRALVESGAGKNFIYNIQQGSSPSTEKIDILAEYFNVSTDYLLGNDTSTVKDPATDDQIKFALFGTTEVDDELYEDVKRLAKMHQQLRAEKDRKEKK